MSTVELGRADLIDPKEPWTLRKTDIMTGQHEDGSPEFEIIGLRILPDEDFDFLKPKKSSTPQEPSTENPITEPKKE